MLPEIFYALAALTGFTLRRWYLDKSFYAEISPDLVKIVNGNYLIPLLTLYDHYKLAGDYYKCDWVKTKLMLIAKGTEHEEEVLKHFRN